MLSKGLQVPHYRFRENLNNPTDQQVFIEHLLFLDTSPGIWDRQMEFLLWHLLCV